MKKKRYLDYFLLLSTLVIIFSLTLGGLSYVFNQTMKQQQATTLARQAEQLGATLATWDWSTIDAPTVTATIEKNHWLAPNQALAVFDTQGQVIYDSAAAKPTQTEQIPPEIQTVLNGAQTGTAQRNDAEEKQAYFYYAWPLTNGQKTVVVVRLSAPSYAATPSNQHFKQVLAIVLGSVFFFLGLLGCFLLYQKSQPLETVIPVLKKVVKSPAEARSIMRQSSEWQELYDSVNQVSRKMNRTYLAYTSTEEQFNALVDELMIGVFIIDVHGDIQLMNPKMKELLQITDAVRGRSYVELFKEASLIRCLHQVTAEQPVIQQEIKWYREHQPVVLELSLRYIQASAHDYQILGTAYDLTRVRQLEKMQRDFVSNVSHELKTPVTSVLGFTETLLDGAKDDPAILTEFLEIILKDARRLEQLIQEILQLSRDEPTTTATNQALVLYDWLSDLIQHYQPLIQKKQLTVQLLGEKELVYETQPSLLFPVVKNLFENAVQYSDIGGQITVKFRQDAQNLVLEVSDDGLGISQADQLRIFERFYRVDKSRSRHMGGTGLGLSIVQHYTNLLHGKVTLTSQLGVGTTFEVALPRTVS